MRPWPDIARELAAETDKERIRQLTQELNWAIEEQIEDRRLFSTKTGRLLIVSQTHKP